MSEDPVYPPSANPGPAIPPPTPPPAPPLMPAGNLGASTETTTGLAPNIAAGLAILFSFVSGIIFLVLEKRSQFVRFWAMQSTVLGLGLMAFNLVSWVLGAILAHVPIVGWIGAILLALLGLIVGLLAFVLYVIMLIKAFTGEEWSVPIIGKFARQQLVKFPA